MTEPEILSEDLSETLSQLFVLNFKINRFPINQYTGHAGHRDGSFNAAANTTAVFHPG